MPVARRSRIALLGLVIAASGCSGHAGRQVLTSPSRTPSSPAPDTTPAGVAVPTCLQPETRPVEWAAGCGDMSYWLTGLTYQTWGAQRATATGRAGLSRGPDAGIDYAAHIVFDRPVRVHGFGDRYLFSRLVVTYDSGSGPGHAHGDTFDLADVWQQAIEILSQTPPPCEPGECAPY